MAERDSLRKLSRRLPTPPEFREILDSLHKQPDLAIAIVGTALLEAILERLIAKKLAVLTPELEGRLFKNRGPLSDFDSKILMAMALKLIPEDVGKALNAVRSIRNAFAHSTVPVFFTTKEISQKISGELYPFIVCLVELVDPKGNKYKLNEKNAFLLCVNTILYMLDHVLMDIAGANLFFESLQEK